MSRVSRTDYSGDRIAKLEKQIDSLYTMDIKSQTRIAYESDRINYLEKQMKGIQDDIKGIKGDLGGMGRQLSKLEKQMKGIQVDQDDEDAQWKWIKKSRALLSGMDYKFMIIEERVKALEDKK